jgi:HemY protein
MLRALWFLLKVGLLAAAAVWIANRPGTIDISWQGYDIHADAAVAFLATLLCIVILLILSRAVAGTLAMPKIWQRYRVHIRQQKGMKSLTLGLAAAAAGDARLAGYHAHRTRALLPRDEGLSVLLEGLAARLKGDETAAKNSFERLLSNKDTAFLGLRGLMQEALAQGHEADATDLAARAVKLYPRHPFVLRMIYALELRHGHWDEAQKLLARLERMKAVEPSTASSDRIALLLQKAEEAPVKEALPLLKKAWRTDHASVPAALRLARYYMDNAKRADAAAVLEKAWVLNPHPALLPLWREAAPPIKGDSTQRLRWFERLITLQPASIDAHMTAASAAMDEQLWGVARQYLDTAGNLGLAPARFYHLRARLAQAQHRPDEAALMLRRATDAPPEKTWICRETGNVYESWSPIAAPHGGFNTIVWDYPQPFRVAIKNNDPADLLLANLTR